MHTPTTPRANGLSTQRQPLTPPSHGRATGPVPPIDPLLRSDPPSGTPAEENRNGGESQDSQSLKRGPDDSEKWADMELEGPDHDPQGSDNDTENGDASARKKKGQRFFCTGYPPCNLSFTRSEHLARHIRKHTGERPFQCHCNRRFSRLDNLRQHAQTVHVNEDIPTDSLAATGTRFQRQIRTDRVRPTGRPRTNTMSSTGSHGRGHSRNASTSSIGSTSSNFSTSTEPRRRPPPLAMATDATGRPKLGIDPPTTPPSMYRSYGDQSPGGLSTPTSTTFPATPGSPGYGSSTGSPGFFAPRPPARRLSVPSGPNPFHPPYPNTYPPPYPPHMGPPSNVSGGSSIYASPVATTFAPGNVYPVPPGEDWRRRTWHPSTYYGAGYNYARPATSGLTYSQTPDAPQPAFAANATAAAGQAPRLPGIESFDHVQYRPSTPPRRQPSPMQLDQSPQTLPLPHAAGPLPGPAPGPALRPAHASWHGPQNVHYPGPVQPSAPTSDSSSWGQETIKELQNVGTRPDVGLKRSEMGPPPPVNTLQHPQQIAQEALQLQPSTPKRTKRQGWYNGPLTATRTSPEDSSSSDGVPTPGTSAAEVHPAIVHSNGYIEPHHASSTDSQVSVSILSSPSTDRTNSTQQCAPPPSIAYPPHTSHHPRSPLYTQPRSGPSELSGLEALVAVATSEEKATAKAI